MRACIVGKKACILAAALSLAVMHAAASVGGNKDDFDPAEQARAMWKEGAVLHLEEKYEAAVARFHEALELHPSARTRTYLAWSLSKLGRYEEAAAHAREAISLDPDYPNAYNDLGAYLIELKRPEQAIPWLEQAAGMRDYCCPYYSYYQIGRARLMQGRIEEAKEALRGAAAINPRYRPARELLQSIRAGGFKGS